MEKRTRLPLIALTAGLISLQVGAQTNTFPTTGNAGIGTTTPQHGFVIQNSENQTTLGLNSTASMRLLNPYTGAFGSRFELQFGTAGQTTTNGLLAVIASQYTGFGSYVAGDLLFGTKDGNTTSVLERMRISSAGYVGIGTNAPMGKFHVVTDGNGFIIQRIAGPPSLQMQTAMGTSTSPLVVYEGNITGTILGNGYDGSEYYATGRVQFEVDGTAGTNDMPGRLTFYTTPDGSITSAERMRITNAGKVGIGTTAPDNFLHIKYASSGGSTYQAKGLTIEGDTRASIQLLSNNTSDQYLMFGKASLANRAWVGYDHSINEMNFTHYSTAGNFIFDNGKVGIGTHSPAAKLHVVLDGNGANFQRYAGTPALYFRRASGTEASPTIVASGDKVGYYSASGYDGANYKDLGGISFDVDGTPGTNDMPGRMTFSTTSDGTASAAERMRITNAGKVGIGTTAPSTKFHVSENLTGVYAMTLENTHTTGSGLLIKAGGAGSNMNLLTITDNAGGEILKVRGVDKTMYVRELEVRIGSFPDYVFEKNYPLMPLSELEAYINKNKHLPNVPSAKEVEENGANVGNLVKVQMEKIEELTLYLIELKKENEEIKKQLEEIKNK